MTPWTTNWIASQASGQSAPRPCYQTDKPVEKTPAFFYSCRRTKRMVYIYMIWVRSTTPCALILSSIKILSWCTMFAKTWIWLSWTEQPQSRVVTHRGTYPGSRARGWALRHRHTRRPRPRRKTKLQLRGVRQENPRQSRGQTTGRLRNRTIRTSCSRPRKATCRRWWTCSTLPRNSSKSQISILRARTSGQRFIMQLTKATATS